MSQFKRLFSLILAVILCAGLFPASVSAADGVPGLDHFTKSRTWSDGLFDDVSESDWFYENVKSVYEYDLMIGRGERTFAPEEIITAAETLTVAAAMTSRRVTRGMPRMPITARKRESSRAGRRI